MNKKITLLFSLMLTVGAFAQNRVTLIETFTSSSCGPCAPGNINLEGILADPQNDNKQVSLKYQMDWPGNGDPYYTDEGGQRRGVYGISAIPASRIDGTNEYNTGSLTQGNLNSAYAVTPKAIITATYTVDAPSKTVDVDITVEATAAIDQGTRLFAAIFEYATYNNVETNGETEFFHVMKKMLPDPSGTIMPALAIGQTFNYTETYTFNGSYRLPNDANDPINNAIEHSVEEFTDLGIAAWIQPSGPQFEANSPAAVAGIYTVATASFGAAIPTTPLTQDMVIFDDNTGDPYDACEPAVNAAQMSGKIVIIRRGSCEFGCKVEAAENAGAIAVVVVNNVPGAPAGMGAGTCGANVTIPSLMISQTDGEAIIAEIEGGATVNATIVDKGLEVYQAGYGEMLSALNEDIIESSVKLYPNPASESTLVALQLTESQDLTIEVVDMMGQVVWSQQKSNVESGRTVHSIQIADMANGMYTVKLTAGATVVAKRLIVNN